MLAATFLAIFFVPLFYTVVRKLIPGRPAPPTRQDEAVESFEEPEPVGAGEEV